jgi:hypothetical protein
MSKRRDFLKQLAVLPLASGLKPVELVARCPDSTTTEALGPSDSARPDSMFANGTIGGIPVEVECVELSRDFGTGGLPAGPQYLDIYCKSSMDYYPAITEWLNSRKQSIPFSFAVRGHEASGECVILETQTWIVGSGEGYAKFVARSSGQVISTIQA